MQQKQNQWTEKKNSLNIHWISVISFLKQEVHRKLKTYVWNSENDWADFFFRSVIFVASELKILFLQWNNYVVGVNLWVIE